MQPPLSPLPSEIRSVHDAPVYVSHVHPRIVTLPEAWHDSHLVDSGLNRTNDTVPSRSRWWHSLHCTLWCAPVRAKELWREWSNVKTLQPAGWWHLLQSVRPPEANCALCNSLWQFSQRVGVPLYCIEDLPEASRRIWQDEQPEDACLPTRTKPVLE
jgi:hypothetical protein